MRNITHGKWVELVRVVGITSREDEYGTEPQQRR